MSVEASVRSTTRRKVLHASGILAAAGCAGVPGGRPDERPYLTSALEIARWLRGNARPTAGGVTWPADPKEPKRIDPRLYSGAAGPVLFFAELHRATGDVDDLALVRRGADDLATRVPDSPPPHLFGLYSGSEGIAIALFEAFRVTGDGRHRDAALRILGLVLAQARPAQGDGVSWNESCDVMSGSAGTGLFLLWAARALHRPDAVALAVRAGDAVLARGTPAHDGLKWQSTAGAERWMPNFAHGTAGVAYFLASLYLETRERRFLEGALAGARYLHVVERDGLVFHYEPGGQDGGEGRYYLGWCHGPCGTGRLYGRLAQATGDDSWGKSMQRGARALLTSGVPDRRTPGFWNNVGQCCGSAAVAEYALHIHRATGNEHYRAFARRMTSDLLARGTRDQAGLRFIQAEHRNQPQLLVAQNGWMQGAAGLGSWLLRLDADRDRRQVSVDLPDCPFPRNAGRQAARRSRGYPLPAARGTPP